MACFPLEACEGRREERTVALSRKGRRRERKGSESGVVGVERRREWRILGVVGTAVHRREWRSRKGLVAVAGRNRSRRAGVDSLTWIFGFFVFGSKFFVSVPCELWGIGFYRGVNDRFGL